MARIVRAGRLIDGTGGPPRDQAAVVIENGRIADVVDQWTLGDASAHEVIDLGDATLLPGLVDTHTHLNCSGSWEAPVLACTDRHEYRLLRAADNARRALRCGITTLRDCGSRNEVIFPFKAAVQAGITPGPRLLVAGTALTTTGGHCHEEFGREVNSGQELMVGVREQFKLGADVIKIMATDSFMSGSMVSHPQFGPAELKLALDEAHRLGRRVAAHCLSTAGIRIAIECGVDTIEHCAFYKLMPSGQYEVVYEDDLAKRMADAGIYVNPSNAFGYRAFVECREGDQPLPGTVEIGRIRNQRVESWRRLRDRGVMLVPGSDAGWYATSFDDFALVPELMVSEIGMSPMEAIVACTRRAAEAIALADEVGTVEKGKSADLVACEGDPSQDIRAIERVVLTILRGQVVFAVPTGTAVQAAVPV